MDYSENNIQDNRVSAEFRQRIRQNIEDSINKKFASTVLNELPGLLIKVNLERAVFEYALIFRRYMENQLELNYKNFIIDLSSTLFLDSTFLGSIIVLYKRLNTMGGTLRLVVNSKKIMMISQIRDIGDIIDTFSSVDEAIVNL